jgi:tRNA G18 (ribose-2'-O)-methylase SpoU
VEALRVDSVDDPRVADYRDVRDRDLHRRDSLFIVEGRENLRRLLADSSYRPRSLLLSGPAHAALAGWLDRLAPETPVFVAARELLQGLAGFDVHRGCLAVCERRPELRPQALLAPPGRASTLLVLEGLTNPDNVGSLFRNAQAFGVDAVLLCPRCCDPLYRKAIRVSMGAALCVPTARFRTWPEGLALLRESGYRILALDPAPGALEVGDPELPERAGDRVALVLGTEGVGLSDGARAAADLRVRIGMVEGFDSINVATAGAVALHQLFRSSGLAPGSPGSSA